MHPERFTATATSTNTSTATQGTPGNHTAATRRKKEKAVSVRIIDVSLETITSIQVLLHYGVFSLFAKCLLGKIINLMVFVRIVGE